MQEECVSHQQVEQELCFCFACDIEISMNLIVLMFSLKNFFACPDLQHEREHHFHVEVGHPSMLTAVRLSQTWQFCMLIPVQGGGRRACRAARPCAGCPLLSSGTQ